MTDLHPSSGTPRPVDPATVLVVEDDPEMQALISAILGNRGHAVLRAMDGPAGLARAAEADLVLLDAMLPGLDGWSVCRAIKDEHPGLPVIMVTGRTGREDVLRTFEAGADDYIAKPFHGGELLARVDSRLAGRRAEHALRLALERYELAARASSEVLWEWDVSLGRLTWSATLTDVFGHPATGETTSIDWWLAHVHPAHRDRVSRTLDETLRSADASWEQEYRFRRGDGSWAEVVDRGFVMREGGDPVRMIGSIMDITGRKRLEGTLRFLSETSAVLADALDAGDMLAAVARVSPGYLGDVALVLRDVGEGAFTIAAVAHADATRQHAVDAVAADFRLSRGGSDSPLARCIAEGEAVLLPASGMPSLADLHLQAVIVVPLTVASASDAALLFGATAGVPALEPADLDVARELGRRTSLALEKARLYQGVEVAERRYRLLFERNPQALLVWDVETHRIVAANPAARELYGYDLEHFLTLTVEELRAPERQGELSLALQNRAADGGWRGRTVHLNAAGEAVDVEIVANDLEFEGRPSRLVMVVDVRERVRSERALQETAAQLRQAQKMEAIGQLAGGVAHDFNNLLTAIQGHAHLLMEQLQDGTLLADVEEIERAARRAAGLTQQLLAFGRRQVLQPRVLDLNEAVSELERMLRRIIGENILMSTRLAPELPAVRADPGQMEQVIVNLVVNAKDAMPAGGRLEIRTRCAEVAPGTTVEGLTGGRHAVLEVRDSGEGMPPDVVEHIFEPFFTTKAVGKGTGLGLSTVYGIVRQTGGAVEVTSTPGAGTCFTIYLPAVDAPLPPTPVRPRPASPVDARDPTGGVVLLVEDEGAVRQLARRVLARAGYEVLEATDGNGALEIMGARQGGVDLLVTDVIMPGMGGPELARRLRRSYPGLPVLFISGYAEDDIVDHGFLQEGVDFLGKPFMPDELVGRVQAILTSPGSAAR